MTGRRWAAAAAIAASVALAGVAVFLLRPATVDDTAPLVAYRRTDDPRQIVVVAYLRPGEALGPHEVQEDSDKVRVAVRVRADQGIFLNIGIRTDVLVTLRQPLAGRRVVDRTDKVLDEQPQ